MRRAVKRVMSMVDVVGECWIYSGPNRVFDRGQQRLARIVLYEHVCGEAPHLHALRMVPGCLSPECVRPTHTAVISTRVANATWQCECGNPKDIGEAECERCMTLDGAGFIEAEIIHELRHAGRMTAMQLAFNIGVNETHVYGTLRKLRDRGRVTMRQDQTLIESFCGKPTQTVALVDRA